MRLELRRTLRIGHATLGQLLIDGHHQCFTAEDVEREEKVPGVTAIPRGRYPLSLRTRGGFHERYAVRWPEWHRHGMLWLRGVPGFTYVLIHPGNTPADTRGCILPGETMRATGVGRSVRAYQSLYLELAPRLVEDGWLGLDSFELHITAAPGLPEPLAA